MTSAETARTRAAAILAGWADPATPAEALAYRPLAEAVTGVPCPLPVEPEEVERAVAVARRNREYSAAHTDAMLPGDPPLLPGLLARAEALDARERAAFADRLVERERRRDLGVGAAAADLRLAHALRELVLTLEPVEAAAVCLRFGLAGDRPRRLDEVAAALGADVATVRRLEAAAFERLRDRATADAFRIVLDAAVARSRPPYP